MKRSVLPLLLSCALALPSVGVARAAGPEDEAKAKALFDEARDLVKDGKWAEACDKLAASKRLVPRMLTTYRLADCHEHVGKTASAHAGFVEAAELAKAVGDADKRQDALARAKQVEAKLSRVVLDLPADPSITIRIDGVSIAPALVREKLPLDPGEHELVASADGKKPRTTTFTVPEGPALTHVAVEPLEAAATESEKPAPVVVAPPPTDGLPADTGPTTFKTVGWATLGVGLVAVGLGTYLGLSAKSLDDDAAKLCEPRGCTPEGKALNDDARARGNVATVVFTLGAVAAASGLAMVLIAPSKSSKTTATVSPWVAHTGGGLGLQGRF